MFQRLWPYGESVSVQGSRMYMDPYIGSQAMRMTFQHYATNQIHEPSTTRLFEELVKPGDVVVDIGANIGYFTLLAAKLVGSKGRVYAFEPEPRNFGFLKKNIELNGYTNVFAFQKAISDKAEKVKLFLCDSDTGHHTINQYDGIDVYKPNLGKEREKFVEVDSVILDEQFKEGSKVDIVKMDCEGAEWLALAGMDKLIRSNMKMVMFIEFFPLLMRKMKTSPEDFITKLLKDYEFVMFVIEDDYSMRDNSKSEKGVKKIDNLDQLMDYCRGESDHVNLLVGKGHKLFK